MKFYPGINIYQGIKIIPEPLTPDNISGLALNLDSDLGITTSDASVSSDLSLWTTAATGMTFTPGQSDPFGGTGAGLFACTGVSSHHYTARGITNAQNSVKIVFRAWLKAGPNLTNNLVFLRIANCNASFNMSTGLPVTRLNCTSRVIQSIGDWHHCEITSTATLSWAQADVLPRTIEVHAGLDDVFVYLPEVIQQRVSIWVDQTGNTNVTQATAANQPLYNGLGLGMTLDGVDDYLDSNVTLSTLRYLHSEATVFIAMERRSNENGEVLLATSSLSSSVVGYHLRLSQNGSALTIGNGSGDEFVVFTNSSAVVGNGKYIYTTAMDSSGFLCRSNQEEGTGSTTAVPASDTDPQTQLRVGDQTSDFDGTIYQVLAYNRKLTTNEIIKVEAYLSNRWNIPFSISSLTTIPDLLSLWDSSLGTTINAAAIDGDLTSVNWNETDLDVTEPSPGVYRLTLSGGAASHRIDYVSGGADNTVDGPAEIVFDVDTSTATQQWWRILIEAADSQWFDAQNGVLGTVTGTINSASVEDLGGGIVRFRVNSPVVGSGIGIRFQATSIDGGGFTTSNDGAFVELSNVSISQDKVSAWADQVTSNDLIQATTDNQPLLISNVKSGLPAMRFDGVSDYLQDTFTLNQDYEIVLAGAFRGSPGVSSQLMFDGVSNPAQFLRLTSDLPQILGSASFTGTFPSASTNWYYYGLSFDGASSRMQINDSVFTGDVGTAAAGGITLGASRLFTNPAPADIGELAIFDRVLTTAERELVKKYFEEKWLTFLTPRDLSGNVLWLDPYFVIEEASKLTHWRDKALVRAYVAEQSVAGEQPTVTATPSVQFDGVADNLDIPGSASDANFKCLHDGTGGTLIMVFKPTNVAASNPILAANITGLTDIGFRVQLSSTTGRILAQVADGTAGVPAAQVVASNSLVNGEVYVIAFRFDSTSLLASYVSLNDGDREDLSDSSVNTPDIGDSSQDITLCGTPTSSVSSTAGELFDVIVYDRKLSNAELTTIENWASGRWSEQTVNFWINGVNVTTVGTTVTKSGGVDGTFDAGAFSNTTLDYTSEGSISFVASAAVGTVIVGFSPTDGDASYTTIAYGMFESGALVRVYELGSMKTSTTCAYGDVLSVELSAGTILYKKNGTTIYTSLVAPSADLHPDCTLAILGGTITPTISGPGWS